MVGQRRPRRGSGVGARRRLEVVLIDMSADAEVSTQTVPGYKWV
jgi:hypothetical protein